MPSILKHALGPSCTAKPCVIGPRFRSVTCLFFWLVTRDHVVGRNLEVPPRTSGLSLASNSRTQVLLGRCRLSSCLSGPWETAAFGRSPAFPGGGFGAVV